MIKSRYELNDSRTVEIFLVKKCLEKIRGDCNGSYTNETSKGPCK